MSTPLKTYDPSNVILTFLGAIAHGYADGTFVTAKRSADAYDDMAGADGEVTRIRVLNELGDVELVLTQTSTFNDVLAAQLALGTVGALLLKDLSGSTLCSADQAWIKKAPDAAFGKELNTRTWTLRCAHLVMFVGGIQGS